MVRPSGERAASCPELPRIMKLEERMAMLDGNEHDKSGGRMGRLESQVWWMLTVGVLTLLASVGTLFGMMMQVRK